MNQNVIKKKRKHANVNILHQNHKDTKVIKKNTLLLLWTMTTSPPQRSGHLLQDAICCRMVSITRATTGLE